MTGRTGDELLDIYREAADVVMTEQVTPPASCPHDGTVLQTGPEGQLHCRFDGYEYPRDGRLI